MTVNVVLKGTHPDPTAAERALQEVLDAAFGADAGELNIVLLAAADGYVVVFARAILEHAASLDYANEVREALRGAGMVVSGS